MTATLAIYLEQKEVLKKGYSGIQNFKFEKYQKKVVSLQDRILKRRKDTTRKNN